MDIRPIVKIVGGVIVPGVGISMLIPALYSLIVGGDAAQALFVTAAFAILLGVTCQFLFRSYGEMQLRAAFAVVTLSWAAAAAVGGIPYYITGTLPSYADSFFEAMSGFTGFGGTALQDIEGVGKDLLLWRSITHGLGGIGVITFFIAILPMLGIGGVHLFRAEASGPQKTSFMPRVKDAARSAWLIYISMLVIVTVALKLAGLSFFDAINHALSSVATGGFSTKNSGIAAFHSPAVEYIISASMFFSSLNFGLIYLLLCGNFKRVFADTEFKSYLFILLIFVLTLSFYNWYTGTYAIFSDSFRLSLFTVLASVSSAGFTNVNYLEWDYFPQFLLILLVIMGGMSGSTSSGLKCIRIVAAGKLILKELKNALHPNALLVVRINQTTIRPEIAVAIWAAIFIYVILACFVTMVLLLDGVEIYSAVTVAISALSQNGPAFGHYGPYDSYALLPASAKWVLSFAMLVGRLEFYTALVIFTPAYWRK